MKRSVSAFLIGLGGSVLLGSASPATAQPKSPPQVTGVLRASNVALAKGDSTILTLQGSNFIYVTSAEAVHEAEATTKPVATSALQRPAGVKVTLTGVRTPTTLGLQVEAPFTAPDGPYHLRLWAGGQAFDFPLETLKITVYWGRPSILDCVPRQAKVGDVVTLKGKYFGDPAQPEKSQVLAYVQPAGQVGRRQAAELVSLSATEAKVRVPDLAVYASWNVVTPGGIDWMIPFIGFDPLYVRTLSPDLFQTSGTLGIMNFSGSQFIFADGTLNSVFLPSSAMRGMGFPEVYPFTFPTYEKLVDFAIGSTKIRVRLNGTNRLSRAESLQSTFLNMAPAGTALRVEARFESDGVEFCGEYETQDVFSKKITWHRFLDLNIDNLTLTAELTPVFYSARDLRIQSVTASSSFAPGFVLLDQNFSVDNTPIKDFIKSELEASFKNYLMSDSFRLAFLPILNNQVQTLFLGCPTLKWIDVGRADDGGMKLSGSTRPTR